MFVYIRSTAFVTVVTQKLVLQQSKNVTAKFMETLAPSFYSILLEGHEVYIQGYQQILVPWTWSLFTGLPTNIGTKDMKFIYRVTNKYWYQGHEVYIQSYRQILVMLSTFPKDFSQVATSQGYFPKWQLHKWAISQAATSQVYPSRRVRPHNAACGGWEGLT